MKIILEYLWLDGHTVSDIKSLTKIIDIDIRKVDGIGSYFGKTPRLLDQIDDDKLIPFISIEGELINQEPTDGNKTILKPVKLYLNGFRSDSYIVLCEVYDGVIPHKTNSRQVLSELINDETKNVSFTQSFVITNFDERQVGSDVLKGYKEAYTIKPKYNAGIKIVNELIDYSLNIGLSLSRIENKYHGNCKWEYHTNEGNPLEIADDIIVLRYLLYKLAINNNMDLSYSNKYFKEIITIKDKINDPYLLIKQSLVE